MQYAPNLAPSHLAFACPEETLRRARPHAPPRALPRQFAPRIKKEEADEIITRRPLLFPPRSPPATPRRRRGWRWRGRRWHSPVMRRRRRRRRHPPMVAMVMMVVVCDHAAIHVSTGERCSGECDCGKGRDEFDLVHGMVPFWFVVMCFVRWKLRSVRRRARQGAMLRSRTSPPCGVWCCGGSRGGDCHGDASAHDASHGAEAEARDAQPRVWAQDASARNAPPRVPFPEPSSPAAYAWPEQEPLRCAQQAREPSPLAASVPVPSSPSEPCPSAEGSLSERPSPCRTERRIPRAPSPSSVLPCSLSCSFRRPRKPILALTQRQDDPPELSDKRFRGGALAESNPRFGIILRKGSCVGV